MPTIQIKRGTRSQINNAASANQLKVGEPYFVSDENRLAIGTAINNYASFPTQSEVDALAYNQDWGLIDGSLASYDDFGGLV